MKKIYFVLALQLLLLLSFFNGYGQTFTSVDINPGAPGSNPGGFVQFNNKLYFSATDATHGTELWVSDGTVAGTMLVKDIYPGPASSGPENLTVFNGSLYFSATDSLHGNELWISDGTGNGTVLLADIWPGPNGSSPGRVGSFIQLGNILIFGATDSAHGNELWKTDGTAAGTTLLSDIHPGTGDSYPGETGGFINCNGKVYFSANNGLSGIELWVTDGTTGGTIMVDDINPGTASSYPGYISGYGPGFFIFNNDVYFEADNGVNGSELWKTDGTTHGTQMVADIWPGAGDGNPGFLSGMTVYNNKLYFQASDSIHGYELWVSDGTGAGTGLVKDIFPGISSSNPSGFTLYAGKLYFTAEETIENLQLFVTDGTGAGTMQVSTIDSAGNAVGLDPSNLTVLNNLLYMVGFDSATGEQLFVTNGTDTGITMLDPPIATNQEPLYRVPAYNGLFLFNNSLVFPGDYTSIGVELWLYTPAASTNAVNTVPAGLDIAVYPNPFTDNITLQGLQPDITYLLTLSDVTGKLIEQQKIAGINGNMVLHTPALSTGIYVLQVGNEDKVQTLKLVKQ